MENNKIDLKVTSRLRVQKYRASHRRIDYAPSSDVLALIERHLP